MVDRGGLENRCGSRGHRGFKSHPLRSQKLFAARVLTPRPSPLTKTVRCKGADPATLSAKKQAARVLTPRPSRISSHSIEAFSPSPTQLDLIISSLTQLRFAHRI